MERHFFAGANTADGFVNLYDYILDRKTCNAFFIIKGGSGVGKSTMLRKIAGHFKGKGLTVEYFHCSSDIASLDGVCFPEIKVALVDGTAPHVIEPKYVGCGDKVIDLASCIDESVLAGQKPKLVQLMDIKKTCYDMAYKYMEIAGAYYEIAYEKAVKNLDKVRINYLVKECLGEIYDGEKFNLKKFSSAFTAEGETSFASDYGDKNIYYFEKSPYVHYFLQRLKTFTDGEGKIASEYYSPYSRKYLCEIEYKNALFTTNSEAVGGSKTKIDLTPSLMNKEEKLPELEIAKTVALEATKFFEKAKSTHFEIEKIYRPAVNFTKVNARAQGVISNIENYLY